MRKDNIVEEIKALLYKFHNSIMKKSETGKEKSSSTDITKVKTSQNKSNKVFNTTCLILAGILLLLLGNILTGSASTKDKAAMGEQKVEVTSDKNQEVVSSENPKSTEAKTSLEKYGEKLNKELKNLLGNIEGVGKIEAMIYFEAGEEKVPAINSNGSNSFTEETDTSGGKREINQNNNGDSVAVFNEGSDTKPLITTVKQPKITGICVVAEGAEDSITELRITRAVVNLFNLPEEKVQVYPMKK